MKSTRLVMPISLWIALSLTFFYSPPAAHASNIVVDRSDGDIASGNGCSLWEAVSNAFFNNQGFVDCTVGSGADTITFNSSVNTISLSGVTLISQDLTIDGGTSGVTIKSSSGRVFQVISGQVLFNNITIAESNGGMLINSGGTVTLTQVVVRNNQLSTALGAGIRNQGYLVISNSQILSNTTSNSNNHGGGICNDPNSTLILENSLVSGNSTASDAEGGGIYNNHDASMSITNSIISNNQSFDGGGIRNLSNANFTLVNSILTGNAALGSGEGGGIYNTGMMSIVNTQVSNNQANNGGGIRSMSIAKLTMDNSVINNNTTASNGEGGGIFNSGVMSITNTSVSDNQAYHGSGIRNLSTAQLVLTGSVVNRNIAFSNGEGGGVYNTGVMSVTNTRINENQAYNGSGIRNLSTAQLLVRNSLIFGNVSNNSGSGSGLYNTGQATISDSSIYNNRGYYGGGIYNSAITSNLIITNTTVMSNQALNGAIGGGGLANSGGRAIITNSTFSGNLSHHFGGGIYQKSTGSLQLDFVTVVDNTANSDSFGGGTGGGIYNESGTMSLKNSIVARNKDNSPTTKILDVYGAFTDRGYNLIGAVDYSTGFNASTTFTGTFSAPFDPMMDTLQNNGGATLTHALLNGSPAIDTGNDTNAPPTDQRGQARLQGFAADMGAYESPFTNVITSTVQFSQAMYQVNENGGNAVITLTRTGFGLSTVQVVIGSDTAVAGVDFNDSAFPLVITFANSQMSQIVTIPISDNFTIAALSKTFMVTATAISNAVMGANITATVDILENDVAGVSASPLTGLATSESNTTATFALSLTTQPAETVTLILTSSHIAEGLPKPTVITFTPSDWFIPQSVMVTGQDDLFTDGNITYTVVMTASSGDPFYNNLPTLPSVSLVNLDNDNPFITVSPTSGLTTTEWGGYANFSLVLNTMPTATVTITMISLNTAEGTVTPTSVTFDASNWAIPQVITVNGGNGSIDDGAAIYTIQTQAAVSADPLYNGFDPADVVLTNLDDDVAGMVITPTSGLVTTEAGGAAVFSVTLTSQPTSQVVITFASSDSTEGLPLPSVITFTAGYTDWQIPHVITVTGQDDALVDGSVMYSITTVSVVSLDPMYNNYNLGSVILVNQDDDIFLPNVNPIAQNDTITITEDVPMTLTVWSNDSDADGFIVPTTLNLVSAPLYGQVKLNFNGTIVYTPSLNFNGIDVFYYRIQDNVGATSNVAAIYLTVVPANDPPTITQPISDQIVMENSLIQITIPAFYDLDSGDILSYTAQLSGGLTLPSWLQFDPSTRRFSGMASNDAVGDWFIQVTATDLAHAFVTQFFTLTVMNENDPPFVTMSLPDQSVSENQPFSFIINTTVFSDIDVGDVLTFTATLSDGSPLPSWLTFNPTTGTFTGTASNAQVGTWGLKIVASDKSFATASAPFNLVVINVNEPPLAQADIATTPEQTPVTISVLANDSDPDTGDVIALTNVSVPLHGTAVISGAAIVYTPPSNFNGVVTFTYHIADSALLTAVATVTVLVGNQAEIGRPDEVVTLEDTPITIDVLANDTNQGSGNHGLSVLAAGVPMHGRTTLSGSQVIYQPSLDFYGIDTFVYIVINGEVADLETVTVTVQAVNDGLTARADVATTAQNVPITLHVIANDSDPDNDTLTLQTISSPSHGMVESKYNDIIYTPAADFIGQDSFSYIVTDGALTATAQVIINVVAVMPPVAVDDTFQAIQGQAITWPILANDYDPHSLPLEIVTLGTPRHGQAILSGTMIIYTAQPDFSGADYFEYGVSNGNLTDIAMVWVQVSAVVPTTSTLPITITDGLTFTMPITWPHTTVITPPLHGQVVISDGQVIYLPDDGFVGTEIITLTVSDGTVTETVVIRVTVDADIIPPTFNTDLVLLDPIGSMVLKTVRPTFTWQAATDNVGVISYTLLITPLNQAPFVITTMTPHYTPPFDLPQGSYQWTVIAHDAAGNASAAVLPETFVLKLPSTSHIFLPIVE